MQNVCKNMHLHVTKCKKLILIFLAFERYHSFWKYIRAFTKLILDTIVDLNPRTCLLNVMPELMLDKGKCRILIITTCFAKTCILLYWKYIFPPTFNLQQLSYFLSLKKLILCRFHLLKDFRSLCLSYLENHSSEFSLT